MNAKQSKIYCWQHEGESTIKVLMQQLFFIHTLAASVLLLSLLLLSVNSFAGDHTRLYEIDIAQQDVAKALTRLSEQADVQVFFPYNLTKGKTANAIKGNFTVLQALDLMLKGSGLHGGISKNGVLTISLGELKGDEILRGDKSMLKSKKNLLAATVAFFVGSGASGVMAQEKIGAEEQRGIDEIVVTAQRREQRLIDVPISITAIGEEALKNTGIKTITDLSYYVSNFSIADFGGGASDYIIRGVANGISSSPLVGVYLDEMPLSLSQFLPLPLQTTDIKRVEVLKGPQGTLFGQGSVGGTIRYITNSPNLEEVEGSVSTSMFNTTDGDTSEELNGVLSIPVIKDTLAFRVAAKYSDQGGWIDQPTLDKEDVNDSLLQDVRVTGLWRVTDDFDVKVMANRYRNSMGAGNDTNGGATSTNLNLPLANDIDIASIGTGIEDTFDLNNIELNYDFGNITLMSSTSLIDAESIRRFHSLKQEFTTPAFGLFDSWDGSRTIYELDTKGFSQELRLVGESEALNWTVGALYADIENNTHFISRVYESGNLVFGAPLDLRRFNGSKSQAIYGEVSYDFSNKLTVSFGSRYFKDDRRYRDAINGISAAGSLSASFDKVTSSIKTSYAITDDSNIYLNISEGFRSGGFNVRSGITFEPEELISYELGAKAAFLDGRLVADGAIFRSDYKDYQAITQISVGAALSQVTGNPGEVEMEGLEFTVQYSIIENLKVGFSGGVVNAEFVKTDPAVTEKLPGDSPTLIPKYSYSAMLDYDFNWSSSTAGFFHIDYARTAEKADPGRNEPYARTTVSEAMGFLNAQLGAKIDNFTVRVFSNNMGNELRSQTPNNIAPNHNFQRRPRTIGFDINYDF